MFSGSNVFFHLKSFDFDWAEYNNLRDISIGGTIGYTYSHDLVRAEQADVIKVDRVPRDEMNFKKLLKGRIDIFPINLEVGYFLIRDIFPEIDIQKITHHPRILNKDNYYLIFSKQIKQNEQMLKIFNRGLKKLKESGRYDQYISASQRGDYIIKK